jgi:chromosomal replication initiator protein
MAARSGSRPLTPNGIRRSLARQLPAEVAELLALAVEYRCSTRGVTVVIPNALWEEVFRRHAEAVVERLTRRVGLRLRIVSLQDAVADAVAGDATFATFLADPGNQFALTSCRRIVESPGTEHNPLLLHGPHGCGKTHLLCGVAAAYREQLGDKAVVSFTGAGFVRTDARSLADQMTSDLHRRLDQAVLVCFDDVDQLAGQHLAQEELYLLINHCLEQGRQLLITALQPPPQIAGLEDRLATRLAWGLSVAIDLPLAETRLALLRARAGEVADDIPAAELAQLIDTIAPDMRQVVDLATRLRAGERVTRGRTHFDRIIDCVANRLGLRPGDIAGKHRHRPIAIARQTALLLGRRLTDHSLVALGGMLGGRDHATVLYNIQKAEQRLATDPAYATLVTSLTQAVLHG